MLHANETLPSGRSRVTAALAALRFAAGLASVVAGLVAAALAIAATGGPDLAGTVIATLVLLLGFMGLGVARTARAPLRPMRVAIAIGIVIAAYMCYGVPWPPTGGSELGSFLTLVAGIALTATAGVVGARRPHLTCALLALPGLYGVVMVVRFVGYLDAARRTMGSSFGPGLTLAYLLAATLGVAWAAALWHSRVLWRVGVRDDVGAAVPNSAGPGD